MNNFFFVFFKLSAVEFCGAKQFESEIRIEKLFCFAERKKAPFAEPLMKARLCLNTIRTWNRFGIKCDLTHLLRALHLLFQLKIINIGVVKNPYFINANLIT